MHKPMIISFDAYYQHDGRTMPPVAMLFSSIAQHNKNDADWVDSCTVMEIGRARQKRCLRKTCWNDVNEDAISFGLSREDAQVRINRDQKSGSAS